MSSTNTPRFTFPTPTKKLIMKIAIWPKQIVGLFFLLACVTSQAQTVLTADNIELQLQISRDSDGFNACGIRALLVTLPPGKKTVHGSTSFDFSLMMSRGQWHALSKFGTYKYVTGRAQEDTKLVIRRPAPVKFSIARAMDSKPFIPRKYIPAEDDGFTLGIGDMATAAAVISGMANGDQMHVVVRYADERLDHVISFQSQLKSSEQDVLFKCFEEFHTTLESQIKSKNN